MLPVRLISPPETARGAAMTSITLRAVSSAEPSCASSSISSGRASIRAAVEILLESLNLSAADLGRVILTGSFGGQIQAEDALALGLLPPARPESIETVSNGAGLGAALFLADSGPARAGSLVRRAEHINLDSDREFIEKFNTALRLE